MTMRLLWTTHFNALLLKLLLLLKSVQVQSCKKKGFLSHNSQIREELWIVSKSYGYTLTMVAPFRAPPTFVNTVFGTNSDWRVVWPPSSLQILFVEGNPISLQIHFLFFLSLLLQEKVFWHAQSLEEKTLLSCNQLVSPFFVSHISCVYIFCKGCSRSVWRR